MRVFSEINNSSLEIENEGVLILPPSYIGVSRTALFLLKNTNTCNAEVTFRIPEEFKQYLWFDPPNITLGEDEKAKIVCNFVPNQLVSNKIKVLVNVQSKKRSTHQMMICTECVDGGFLVTPQNIDFGVVMVNFIQTKQIVIKNESKATFKIFILPVLVSWDEDDSKEEILKDLKIEFEEGLIGGHLSQSVNLAFRPREKCSAKVRLFMITKPTHPLNKNEKTAEQTQNDIEEIANFASTKINWHFELESKIKQESDELEIREQVLDSRKLRKRKFQIPTKIRRSAIRTGKSRVDNAQEIRKL